MYNFCSGMTHNTICWFETGRRGERKQKRATHRDQTALEEIDKTTLQIHYKRTQTQTSDLSLTVNWIKWMGWNTTILLYLSLTTNGFQLRSCLICVISLMTLTDLLLWVAEYEVVVLLVTFLPASSGRSLSTLALAQHKPSL